MLALSSVKTAIRQRLATPLQLRLLQSLTLPGEYPWPRVSSAYGSDPTATGKLFRKPGLRYPALTGAGDLPANSMVGFAFRDALRAALYAFGLNAGDTCIYVAQFQTRAVAGQGTYYPLYDQPAALDQVASTVSPHGDFLYLGRLGPSDPARGFLCSDGDKMTVLWAGGTGLPPGATVDVVISKFVSTTWVDVFEFNLDPFVGTSFDYGIQSTGYYSVSFNTRTTATSAPSSVYTGTVAITSNGGVMSMMWAQNSLPNIEDVLTQVKSYSVTALSIMMTNTASPLNRQGQIVGLQLPRGTNPFNFIDFDTVSGDAKAFQLDAVNGMYGFAKPTSPSDMDKRVFQFAAAFDIIDQEFVFSLIPESDYLVISAQVTDPNGRQGYWTFDHNVEYVSLSQWADLRLPEAKAMDFESALVLMTQIPQWHENALHLSDIWEGIKDVARGVWGGVKEIAGVAAPLLPLAAALL